MNRQITLTQGLFAVVDESDFENLSQWKWHAWKSGNTFYAKRNDNNRSNGVQGAILMHRVILDLSFGDGFEADHADMNGLNNTRTNLRKATVSQNRANRTKNTNNKSGYKGVSFHKKSGKWCATARENGKHLWLGLFETPELAHEAYKVKLIDIYKEFARVA